MREYIQSIINIFILLINISIPVIPFVYDIIMDKCKLYEGLFRNSSLNSPSKIQIQKIHALYFISFINISILIFICQLLTVNAGEIKYIIAIPFIILVVISSTLSTSFAMNDKFVDPNYRFKIRFYAMIIMIFLGIILETLRLGVIK